MAGRQEAATECISVIRATLSNAETMLREKQSQYNTSLSHREHYTHTHTHTHTLPHTLTAAIELMTRRVMEGGRGGSRKNRRPKKQEEKRQRKQKYNKDHRKSKNDYEKKENKQGGVKMRKVKIKITKTQKR